MLDLDEIIAHAEAAPRQTADIEVIFDTGISHELEKLKDQQTDLNQQIDDIETDLAAELEILGKDRRVSDGRPAEAQQKADTAIAELRAQLDELDPKIREVEERAADYLVTFRLTALHGFEWEDLTSRSAPRENHPEDASVGHNVDEVARIVVARTAVRVAPDGELIDVTAAQWDGIWKALPSLGLRRLKNTVYVLNQWAEQRAQNEAVVAARKVLTARQAETQPSPSDSRSTPAASKGGNPRSSSTTGTTTKAA